jgi:hypothetical protein
MPDVLTKPKQICPPTHPYYSQTSNADATSWFNVYSQCVKFPGCLAYMEARVNGTLSPNQRTRIANAPQGFNSIMMLLFAEMTQAVFPVDALCAYWVFSINSTATTFASTKLFTPSMFNSQELTQALQAQLSVRFLFSAI